MSGTSLSSRLFVLSGVALVAILAAPVMAQQASKEDRTLAGARDSWPIHVTYYPSRLKENAVIAADLRKHGQSKPTSGVKGAGKKKGSGSKLTRFDYQLMVTSDMEAIKKFIFSEHQNKRLNMRKLGVVAAGMSSPVAVAFAANDWSKKPHSDAPTVAARTPRGQDVRALVLLSPQGSLPGMTINRPMKFLKGKAAFLVCVGERRSRAQLADANRVYNFLKPISDDPEKRMNWMNSFPVQLQGTDLLGKQIGVENVVVGFLKRYVGDLKDPWKDRRSRAAR